MITLIGVLIITLGIVLIVWRKFNAALTRENAEITRENDRIERDGLNLRRQTPLKRIIQPFVAMRGIYVIIIGFLVISVNGLFFYANPGTAYAVQYLWGGDEMIATQGVKLKYWGRTIPMSYEMSVKDIILKLDPTTGEVPSLPPDEDGIYNRKSVLWEFSDAIKAHIAISVIVGPDINNEDAFLSMADKNRGESKLIHGRVLPNIDAALKNTCKLMDAQDYISGKASDFDRYFRDQLENGMYLVEEYYDEESPIEIIGDTNTVRTVGVAIIGSTSKQKKFRIKRDRSGNIMRDEETNTLKKYGIAIYQAQVTSIDWEDSFDDRLDKQKEEVALTQLEKQQAEREYYTMQKNIAKGESEKAAKKATLEKEQIEFTIAAETRAKVAEQNVIVERAQLEVEKLRRKSEKEKADAKYYTNQKLVSAGLTPQERLAGDIKMIDVATKNMAGPTGLKLPDFYSPVSGSGSKGATDPLTQIMQLMLAKDLMKK